MKRQARDYRDLAGKLGWAVSEQYVDNDFSAYSGKFRPRYLQSLEHLVAGARDGLRGAGLRLDRLTLPESLR